MALRRRSIGDYGARHWRTARQERECDDEYVFILALLTRPPNSAQQVPESSGSWRELPMFEVRHNGG